MKGYFVKSLMALGAMMMVCSCGDDSSDGSAVSPNPPVNDPCAAYTVFSAGWIQDFGDGTYWVLDQASAAAGMGTIFDANGNPVTGAYFVIDGDVGSVFDSEGPYVTLNMPAQLLCQANATKTETGEIIKSSSSVVTNPSAGGDGTLSSSATSVSAGSEVPASQAGLSSAGTLPGSSAAITSSGGQVDPNVGSSSSVEVVPASSSEKVFTVGNPEEDIKKYPVPTLKNILGNGTSGWNTRYWDACKAHCSQTSTDGAEGKPKINTQEEYAASHYTARVCNINDIEIPTFTYSKGLERYWVGIQNTPNACQEASPASGGGFTCTDMAPVAVNDTLAYAFVAGSDATTSCGKCFHLQYDGSFKDADGNNAPKETHKALKGKHIIVMASNIGHDVKPGQFDLMVPGGGPGIFNALQLQITKPGIEWGATYGGFLTYCQNGEQVGYDGSLADYQKCVKNMCDAAFGDSKYPNLLRGCHWFADWFMAADNPTYQWEEVECPQYLIDKYSTNISTSIETKILYQSDWSTYKGGDFIETDACSKTPNATGEYCNPEQLEADKAKKYE